VAHLFDDVDIVRFDDLGTVIPVGFVTVVLLGVVGGGQDNAALAAQFADGKRHFRCGAEVFKQVDLDAVGREDVGRYLGKLAAVVAAVVTNDHGNLGQVGEGLV